MIENQGLLIALTQYGDLAFQVWENYDPAIHLMYIARWGILAVPGAWFLSQVEKQIDGKYKSMVVSQIILGAIVFFVDKWIFGV